MEICSIYLVFDIIYCQSPALHLYREPAFYWVILVTKNALKYSALFLTRLLW